jgi:hypothetical protein
MRTGHSGIGAAMRAGALLILGDSAIRLLGRR